MVRDVKTNLKIVKKSFAKVFVQPKYIALTATTTFIVFFASLWLSNLHLLKIVFTSSAYDLSAKLKILWSSLGSINTNFTVLTGGLVIVLSIFAGINIALMVYYFKQRAGIQKDAGASLFSIIVGFLGVGCASCGSVILSSIFGLGATAGFIGILPLQGSEFGLIGITGLAISIYLIAKKIQTPLICKI